MKTFIKIVLLSFLFFISFSGQSQAQSGKGAYGNTISRRSGSQQTDYMTRGLRFNADVCAGSNLNTGDVNVTAGAGYQFSPYVYLGGVFGTGNHGYGAKVIVAADSRVYFMKSRLTPMLSAQFGYLWCGSDNGYNRSGDNYVYASCGIGARIYLTKKLGITARFMTSTTVDYDPFLGLCAGIEF